MSPKFVDRGQKAKEIATAALQVFSQKGYGASSIEQIAVVAGVAKGTMYEYFPSKDKLYIAAVMVFVENFESNLIERMAPIEDPFLRLVEFIGFSIETCSMENESSVQILFDILQQSILENGVFFEKKYLVREMMQGSRKMLTDILLEGVSKGIFKVKLGHSIHQMGIGLMTENGIKFSTSLILDNPRASKTKEMGSMFIKSKEIADLPEGFKELTKLKNELFRLEAGKNRRSLKGLQERERILKLIVDNLNANVGSKNNNVYVNEFSLIRTQDLFLVLLLH